MLLNSCKVLRSINLTVQVKQKLSRRISYYFFTAHNSPDNSQDLLVAVITRRRHGGGWPIETSNEVTCYGHKFNNRRILLRQISMDSIEHDPLDKKCEFVSLYPKGLLEKILCIFCLVLGSWVLQQPIVAQAHSKTTSNKPLIENNIQQNLSH